MKKHLILYLYFSGLLFGFSQEVPINSDEKDEILSALLQEETIDDLIKTLTDYQLLYVSVNYNDNTYFSGRDIGIDQYNIRSKVTYQNAKGFSASLTGIYYNEFDPKWDLTIASIGYGKSFGNEKIFRYYTSYSKYFYNNDANNIYTNELSIGLAVKNQKRTLGTQLVGSYLFGEEQSFQLVSSSYYTLKLVKTNKFKLEFKPQLNIIAGQQTIELAQSYMQMGQVFTTYTTNDVFDLINTQVNFPLQFNMKSFDFEVGYNINIPTAIGNESNLKNTRFINFSVGYLFDL